MGGEKKEGSSLFPTREWRVKGREIGHAKAIEDIGNKRHSMGEEKGKKGAAIYQQLPWGRKEGRGEVTCLLPIQRRSTFDKKQKRDCIPRVKGRGGNGRRDQSCNGEGGGGKEKNDLLLTQLLQWAEERKEKGGCAPLCYYTRPRGRSKSKRLCEIKK